MAKPNYQVLIKKIGVLSERLRLIGVRANQIHKDQEISKNGHIVAKLKALLKNSK